MPVMYAAAGKCHVLRGRDAPTSTTPCAIAVNAKVQRPVGVQRGRDAARARRRRGGVPAARAARAARVAGWSCAWTGARARSRATSADSLADATEEDWATEYHALILAVKVVDSAGRGDRARQPLRLRALGGDRDRVGRTSARAFTDGVDAACVYVNASTRFTDGAVFGMGAEIGNSTQKLHARGPIGLRELTTYKFVVEGSGQVRE